MSTPGVLLLCTGLEDTEKHEYPELTQLLAAHRGPATIEVLDYDSAVLRLEPGLAGEISVSAVRPPEHPEGE